jgi:hypothetical protein
MLMVIEWLQKRVTVEEAEAAETLVDKRLGPDPVPFGFGNAKWKQLIAQMREGDELWSFRSPRETWANMSGRMGYSLVRGGRVISSIVTLMN